MCSMAAFCQRLRGTQGDVYAVDPSSVSLTGSGLTAKLANTKSNAQFKLQLTNYEGTVRLHIDEEPSQDRCTHCRSFLGLIQQLSCRADRPLCCQACYFKVAGPSDSPSAVDSPCLGDPACVECVARCMIARLSQGRGAGWCDDAKAYSSHLIVLQSFAPDKALYRLQRLPTGEIHVRFLTPC